MTMDTRMDLENFRQARGLSYRKLAVLLGLSQGRTAQAYARGEFWPDADKLQDIIDRTGRVVTLDAMHARRLAWLSGANGIIHHKSQSALADTP